MLAGGLSHPEYTSSLHLWDGLELQYVSTHDRYTFTNHASLRMQMYAKYINRKKMLLQSQDFMCAEEVGKKYVTVFNCHLDQHYNKWFSI